MDMNRKLKSMNWMLAFVAAVLISSVLCLVMPIRADDDDATPTTQSYSTVNSLAINMESTADYQPLWYGNFSVFCDEDVYPGLIIVDDSLFSTGGAYTLGIDGAALSGVSVDISGAAGDGIIWDVANEEYDVNDGDGLEIIADVIKVKTTDLTSDSIGSFENNYFVNDDGIIETMIDWGVGANQVNPASFDGTDITAAELETLSDGSNADALHVHAGVGGHDILDGATHTDSVAQAVTRGSIIIGNSTPKWDELPIGANNTVLKSDGTDASWQAEAAAPDIWYTLTDDGGNNDAPDTAGNVMFVGGTGMTTSSAAGTPPVDVNISFDFDSTEIGTTTWGAGSAVIWTFNASAGTDTTATFGDDIVTFATANLGTDGSIFIQEIADAIADIAGWGQIWVNTATPNELWFTDDAGTDFQLGIDTDVFVKVDAAAAAGYIGAAANDGVLRATLTDGITYADGGDFITLGLDVDYTDVSANDGATDITGAELEALSDGSTTTLHAHGEITIDSTPDADNTAEGILSSLTAGEAITFPQVCYQNADGEIHLADANAPGEFPAFCMALETKTDGQACSVLMNGYVRDDDWTWTVGGVIYLSETPGGLTQTAPSDDGDMIQVLGVATHADRIWFFPNLMLIEHS